MIICNRHENHRGRVCYPKHHAWWLLNFRGSTSLVLSDHSTTHLCWYESLFIMSSRWRRLWQQKSHLGGTSLNTIELSSSPAPEPLSPEMVASSSFESEFDWKFSYKISRPLILLLITLSIRMVNLRTRMAESCQQNDVCKSCKTLAERY